MSRVNDPQKPNCFSVGRLTYEERRIAESVTNLRIARNLAEEASVLLETDERGRHIGAMSRAALQIVEEAYIVAANLLHEITECPIKEKEKNDQDTSKD